MENTIKKSSTIALAAIIAINVVWLVCYLIQHINSLSFEFFACLFELVVALFYAIYGYKKPHGNLMKYLLFFYVIVVAVILLFNESVQPTYVNAMYLVKIILGTYMSGRLDRYKQNVVICAILLVTSAITSYYFIEVISSFAPLTYVNIVASLGSVTVWLAIAGGYIIRYQLHKEAGLEEK